jgi:hypothetical protein
MSAKTTRLFILGIITGVCFTTVFFAWFINPNSDNSDSDTLPETASQTFMPLPEGDPGNSAPSFALAACSDLQAGDNCTLENGTTTIDGVCYVSGDQLACGLTMPSMPTTTENF